MVLLQRKLYFSKGPEGVGGPNVISIETHITCDFPGGGPDTLPPPPPPPPLWIRTCIGWLCSLVAYIANNWSSLFRVQSVCFQDKMGLDLRKPVFRGLRTTQAQTSLCRCAV